MAGLKIKKGDRVRILQGKDRGKEGVVMRVLPAENKVIVVFAPNPGSVPAAHEAAKAAANLAILLLVLAWGYRLDLYELLLSSRGVVYGASYADGASFDTTGLAGWYTVGAYAYDATLRGLSAEEYTEMIAEQQP